MFIRDTLINIHGCYQLSLDRRSDLGLALYVKKEELVLNSSCQSQYFYLNIHPPSFYTMFY